jgi:hypothetical protein
VRALVLRWIDRSEKQVLHLAKRAGFEMTLVSIGNKLYEMDANGVI